LQKQPQRAAGYIQAPGRGKLKQLTHVRVNIFLHAIPKISPIQSIKEKYYLLLFEEPHRKLRKQSFCEHIKYFAILLDFL